MSLKTVLPPLPPHTHTICRPPLIVMQVSVTIADVGIALRWLTAAMLAASLAGVWHIWELTHVERKADKHRRRRRQRRNCIPWEKIKLENLGPISYCGGGGPPASAATARSAGTGGVTACANATDDKKVV